VGTMETIIRGLKRVCDEALADPSKPIIANCSFTIQIPRLNGGASHEIPIDDSSQAQFKDDLEVLLKTHGAENRIVSIIEPIFELLDKKDVWIVAAAGNDHQQGPRPIARYPAAIKQVIGVSALSERGRDILTSASYSDAADEPQNDGFAVFGGSVDLANRKLTSTDPKKGMLGLYYVDIPTASGASSTPSSSTGYLAYWAGTSFAAPIITGALAVLRARGMNRGQAIEFLKNLYGKKTVDGGSEEVVWVEN
ncbi:MAG TPA: S8 family serine peptidase, partial [Terriglobales bacterium]|nr:S8 family serine peptidase [Terriglobales bacterium]